ncbi:MAG: hypothetical protein LRY37_04990 [Alkalibacterium thalassium]|nr:hypothetical protein [Alkalibacterium thalassium]
MSIKDKLNDYFSLNDTDNDLEEDLSEQTPKKEKKKATETASPTYRGMDELKKICLSECCGHQPPASSEKASH